VACEWPIWTRISNLVRTTSHTFMAHTALLTCDSAGPILNTESNANNLPRYYVLVIASIAAQKVEWAKKACLAAALLLPAVAAIHGVVLAVLHTDGR